MKQIINYTIRFMVIVVLLLLQHSLFAQGPLDPGQRPDEVPVDGGLAFLLAAGVSYGAKKAYDFKKGMRKEK